MKIAETPFWTWTLNDSIERPSSILGKYLFFSDDRKLLQKTGEEILAAYNLSHMKISVDKSPKSDVGFGYVLCIYSESSNLSNELKSRECPGLNYRFFKTDADTRNGVYSDKHKNAQ